MADDSLEEQYTLPGERLDHLLNQIGFAEGRGRTRSLFEFVSQNSTYDFSDLKFGTVRSWFHNHAPTMRKVNAIVDLLSEEYSFEIDKEQIAVWWKVGGYYPFNAASDSLDIDKLDFVITSMISEEVKDSLQDIESSKLLKVKSQTLDMCKAFADPTVSECPTEFIKTFVRGSLRNND